MKNRPDHDPRRWWGHFELDEGVVGRWLVGPMELRVEHRPNEWYIEHGADGDPLSEALALEIPWRGDALMPTAAAVRFAWDHVTSGLLVAPALADRPIVARPTMPLRVPAGEAVRLFVGSPLWLQLGWADQDGILMDLPTYRPSDTWFGPSPVSGELCYATRTGARLQLDNAPVRPGRAITAVTVENRGEDVLAIERIKLPVPQLSLHADRDGRFWSQSLTFCRGRDDDQAEVQLEEGPPEEAGATDQVAVARRGAEGNVFQRALSALLG